MINYLKSESYRLLHKKGLHVTMIILLLLIGFAAAVLYYFGKNEANFPYATEHFFYMNVISSGLPIILIGFIVNQTLTGKDTSIIKQSVSFGIPRRTIFWTKFIITLGYFLFICLIGLFLVIGLGGKLLGNEEQVVGDFLIACINMLPIVLSGFFIIHAMKMMKTSDVYIIITLLFLFAFSDDILRLLFRPIPGLNELYKYAPSTQLNDNLIHFMGQTVQFEFSYWITGLIISATFLLIGLRNFTKQHIN